MAKAEKKPELKEGEKLVNLYDRVKVVGKKGSPYLTAGKVYEVHPEHAKTLIDGNHADKHKDESVKDIAPKDLRALDSQEEDK